ncbi:helix-turn-helix domain-containing protein [Carbonactinospora thermoautotrophica]|uniref:helix-turn-helix domain-containing protein n=1 Tax=Carbonactinospora thermoautotrophica TaxID=1469144 RepID=UPI000BB4E61A|nr:helix-turn-helix transcriptional regulator [Carbonactinospora thermoautotrophica]
MTELEGMTLGARIKELRQRRGMSQKELAAEVGRSESWMSQVERDVQPVERLSVLQALADALGVSVQDLRPEARTAATGEPEPVAARNDLDGLRMTLTGHPALTSLFEARRTEAAFEIDALTEAVDHAWTLAHASRFKELTEALNDLLPRLEAASREAPADQRPHIHQLRARTYQAVAAAFARQGEADAAWVAADRALTAAEQSGHPLDVIAGHFRMAHAFMGLLHNEQAERVAQAAIDVLRPRIEREDSAPEELSLFGAMHLVLAVIAAREGSRATARARIEEARKIADRIGTDRNDFNTEFGPTNVRLHAVSVAVDLGDAGEALDLAKEVDPSGLSPERQARFLLDVARAHAQRRHVGEATAALLRAEQLAPEMIHGHPRSRQTLRDLVQLAGRRAPEELTALARRAAALP